MAKYGCVLLLVAACGDATVSARPPGPGPTPMPAVLELAGGGSVSFLDVTVGTSGVADVVLRNTGGVATGAIRAVVETGAAFAIAGDSDCLGKALVPDATCHLALSFHPTAAGDDRGSVTISADPGGTLALAVSGRGADPGPLVDLTLELSGPALGAVQIQAGATVTTCSERCVVPVPVGAEVILRANTPSRFAGFSGSCASDLATCRFTATDAATVGARFDRDPRERYSLLLPSPVRSVDYDATGNLLVGTETEIIKLDGAGAETWRRPVGGAARAGAGDVVFVRTATSLVKLDGDGHTMWTVDVAAGTCGQRNTFARSWATMPDGGVAIQGPRSLVVYNGADGSVRFASPPIDACRGTLAVDAAGHIYTAVENLDADATDLRVFDAGGAELARRAHVTSQYQAAIASAGDQLVSSSSGHGVTYIASARAAGPAEPGDDPDFVENGAAIDSAGYFASAFAATELYPSFADGVVLRHFAPDGHLQWRLTKPVDADTDPLSPAGVTAVDLDLDSRFDDLAVGGRYVSATFSGGWVEVFGETRVTAPPSYGRLDWQLRDTDADTVVPLPALHQAIITIDPTGADLVVSFAHSAGPTGSLDPFGEYDFDFTSFGRTPAGDLTFRLAGDAFDSASGSVFYVADHGERYFPVCGMSWTGVSDCAFPFSEAIVAPSYRHAGPFFDDHHAPSCDPYGFHHFEFEQPMRLDLPVPLDQLRITASAGAPVVAVYRADGAELGDKDMPELYCGAPAQMTVRDLVPGRYFLVFDGAGDGQAHGTGWEASLETDFSFALSGTAPVGVACTDPLFASGVLQCPHSCTAGLCR